MGKLLFSVTAKDCRWEYMRGSGKGGQKRNKTESCVRCTHPPSGAVGLSDDTRSQHKNKRTAFVRMTETDEFKIWHKVECARHTGAEVQINDAVEAAMRPWNIQVDVFEDGEWKPEGKNLTTA